MAQTTQHDQHGQPIGPVATGMAALRALADAGIDAGRWALQSQPVSSAPQLSYARELHALQRRFSTVMTDRVRHRPGPAGGLRGPRGAQSSSPSGLSWLEPSNAHVHPEPEVRVFLDGRVLLRVLAGSDGGWLSIACEPGDWLALPSGLPHVMQLGRGEGLDMLRLFSSPGGWQAVDARVVLPDTLAHHRTTRPSDARHALAA
jgi:hypothetical protein